MEMTKQEMLAVLRPARELLDKSYIRFRRDDGQGGHCALGAVDMYTGWATSSGSPIEELLSKQAIALFPELVGTIGVRLGCHRTEYFDNCPIVYINNHVDKASTLKCFDAAILELEISLAEVEEDEFEDNLPRILAL